MPLPRRFTKTMVQDKTGVSRQYVSKIIKRYEAGNFIPVTKHQQAIIRRYQAMKKKLQMQ